MHTLFAIEDLYGLHIGEIDGEVCLRLDKDKGSAYLSMFDMFQAWQKQSAKLDAGEITKEEYDEWRYTCLLYTSLLHCFPSPEIRSSNHRLTV